MPNRGIYSKQRGKYHLKLYNVWEEMVMVKKNTQKGNVMTGYDPAQYKRMTIMFVALSLLNVVFVILAFMRTGYGLYHAEEALSRVSDVAQCVHKVNESTQNIVIHCDDADLVTQEIATIDAAFERIELKSSEYREIELDDIDKDLRIEFDSASLMVTSYRNLLKDFTKQVKEPGGADRIVVSQNFANLVEPMKLNAEGSMNALFEKQSKSTTEFFYRAAKQFLFVLLFLFITMTVGILGIRRMKKNARTAAEAVEQERERTSKMREKTVNIAYSNILTGFRNFYGLEKDIADKVGKNDFTIALCRFNRFGQVNEIYGRGKADAFMAQVSKNIMEEFNSKTNIYSTGNDEFCFLFHKKVSQPQAEELVKKIAEKLSEMYTIDGIMIQQTVSCCYYNCAKDAQDNFQQLFCTLDRAMSVAKEQYIKSGQNAVVNVNALA